MKITYYLNEGRKKNLYCRISDAAEKVTFSMGYAVEPKMWNGQKGELSIDDIHSFTLDTFKKYLMQKYHEYKTEGKTDILTRLKNEALFLTDESGIDGIERKFFDDANSENNIPKYDDFVRAFSVYSKLPREQFKVQVMSNSIYFHTKDTVYEMDTYEGKALSLKFLVENKNYDEICIETNVNIWSEIYLDGGIEKHEFLPAMLKQWENYWNDEYQETKELTGKTNQLDIHKESSWRQFQVYMACCDNGVDVINLAYSIDEFILYPISVFAMLEKFDPECCYSEYCDLEFNGKDWETIVLDENSEDGIFFYIREIEL